MTNLCPFYRGLASEAGRQARRALAFLNLTTSFPSTFPEENVKIQTRVKG